MAATCGYPGGLARLWRRRAARFGISLIVRRTRGAARRLSSVVVEVVEDVRRRHDEVMD